MKREVFTEEQVIDELRRKVNLYGAGKVARTLGLPLCSVINVRRGRRGIGPVTARALGFEIVYAKLK